MPEAVEELIGVLGSSKAKAIRIIVVDHHRVNRSFDLLGLTYPDWPQVELTEAKGGKKRKRAKTGGKSTSASKRGGRSHGHAGAPKVDRVAAVKVLA